MAGFTQELVKKPVETPVLKPENDRGEDRLLHKVHTCPDGTETFQCGYTPPRIEAVTGEERGKYVLCMVCYEEDRPVPWVCKLCGKR